LEQQLSPSHRSILHLLASGHTTRDVALLRHVSLHTVRAQLSTVYQALGIHHRAELVLWALNNGFGSKEVRS